MNFLSSVTKFVKKVFKPTNIIRITGALVGGLPGYLQADKYVKDKQAQEAAIKNAQSKSEPVTGPVISQTVSGPTGQIVPQPATQTAEATMTSEPQQHQQQFGTTSAPQTMKLQQTGSPYAAAVTGSAAAQAQQQPVKPISQFSAPSMQGITFGGS